MREHLTPEQVKDHIYSMKVGEQFLNNQVHSSNICWNITRVPNGWIYTAQTSMSPCSVFVPYSDEPNIPY